MQQPNNAPVWYPAWNPNIHCRPHKLQQTDMGSNKRYFFAVPVFFVVDGGFTHGCILRIVLRWPHKRQAFTRSRRPTTDDNSEQV